MVEAAKGETLLYKNLEIFRTASAVAQHAGARQTVIAQNMANADTPSYAAKDIEPFNIALGQGTSAFSPKATRTAHLHGASGPQNYTAITRADSVTDPNGNSVSVETEMLHAVDVKRQHDRALAIYKSALSVMRTAIGR